jgi:hypothetical protein
MSPRCDRKALSRSDCDGVDTPCVVNAAFEVAKACPATAILLYEDGGQEVDLFA